MPFAGTPAFPNSITDAAPGYTIPNFRRKLKTGRYPLSIYTQSRSGFSAADFGTYPNFNEYPADQVGQKATDHYNAASYGAWTKTNSAGASSSSEAHFYVYNQHEGGPDGPGINNEGGQGHVEYNTGVTGGSCYASRSSCKYKFRVDFAVPVAAGSKPVIFRWRVLTTTHKGSRLSTQPRWDVGSAQPPVVYDDPVESADRTFEDMEESVQPEPGATFVESSVYELAMPAYGDVVTVVGPTGDKGLLPPGGLVGNPGVAAGFGLVADSLTGRKQKWGFDSYISDNTGPARIYRTETATTAQGSNVTYSGAQTVTIDSTGNFNGGANTFSESVIGQTGHYSSPQDGGVGNYQSLLYHLPDECDTWEATRIAWKSGLIVTLSNEDPTSRITALVQSIVNQRPLQDYDALSDDDFFDLLQYGIPGAGGSSAGMIAWRNLPLHEQWYGATKGRYVVALNVSVYGNIASFFYDPDTDEALDDVWETPDGDITIKWKRFTHDPYSPELPVGTQKSVSFSLPEKKRSKSATYDEPVPGSNQEVRLGEFEAESDYAYFSTGPVAVIEDDEG